VAEHRRHIPGPDHRRLIQHQHRARAEPTGLRPVQVQQQPGDGAGRQAAVVGQDPGGPGGARHPDHPVAGQLVRAAHRPQHRAGLARPGAGDQHVDAGAQLAASAALAAGFPAEQLVTAVAIAGAESGYDPAATHLNSDGSTDYGLWQINSIHTVLLTQGDWLRRLDGHLTVDIAQGGGVRRDSRSPLRSAPLRWVLLVMLTVGVGLSLLDLAVVARAAGSGNPGAAGYLLAALSVGSAAGGLLWGRLQHRRSHQVQLVGLLVALATATWLAALVPGLLALGVVLGLTGLAVAPVYIVAYLAADLISQPGTRTEATTWVATASNLGGAAGAGVAGYLIDKTSPRTTTLVAGVIFALATLALTTGTAAAKLAALRGRAGTAPAASSRIR